MIPRCAWAPLDDPLYLRYHDEEWGVPVRDEQGLFEMLCLESAQAGLSWRTILHRREGYRRAFAGFRPETVAAFGPDDVARLLEDTGIVRNRRKVESAITNARALLRLRETSGGFAEFLWSFVGGAPRIGHWPDTQEVPSKTTESVAMSRALVSAGFRFVGPTVCYSLMQATGMVMDHITGCFRHAELTEGRPR